jgi:hypothetical protein
MRKIFESTELLLAGMLLDCARASEFSLQPFQKAQERAGKRKIRTPVMSDVSAGRKVVVNYPT